MIHLYWVNLLYVIMIPQNEIIREEIGVKIEQRMCIICKVRCLQMCGLPSTHCVLSMLNNVCSAYLNPNSYSIQFFSILIDASCTGTRKECIITPLQVRYVCTHLCIYQRHILACMRSHNLPLSLIICQCNVTLIYFLSLSFA